MDNLMPISNQRSLFFQQLFSHFIQKFNISSELSTFRGGSNIDHVINNNFHILCPNVDYEIYKGIPIQDLIDWLSLFKNYGDSFFHSFLSRYNQEISILNSVINNNIRSSNFDISTCSSLPPEILSNIYSFLPIRSKAFLILHTSWESILSNFRLIKVQTLIHIIFHIKQHNLSIIHKYPGTWNETSRIKYLLQTPVQRTKTDIIVFIKTLVNSLLNINIRLKSHRLHIIHAGYNIMILCKILADKELKHRSEITIVRKALKKIKRQERIRALKNA